MVKPLKRNHLASRRTPLKKCLRRCRECGEERVTSSKAHDVYRAGARTYCGPFNVVR